MNIDVDYVLSVAERTANKSPCRYKVSCILVDKRKGTIVATGFNHRTNGKRMGKWSVHAEMDALNKVRKPSDNLVAFIYRDKGKCIDPCNACSELLRAYNIRNIFVIRNNLWEKMK